MSFIGRFFLLVLLLSFGELYLLLWVARHLSLLVTLLLCVLTGIVGGAMVRAQGLHTLKQIKLSLGRGQVPGAAIISGLILLVIGTLLLTPGFITDSVAFLLLIPPQRNLAAGKLLAYFSHKVKFAAMSNRQHGHRSGEAGPRRPEDVVIEVDARESAEEP